MKGALKFLFLLSLIVVLIYLPTIPAQAASPGAASPGELSPEISTFVQSLLTRGGWLLLVIAIDLVLGVTVALKQHIFKWSKLADFLASYGPKIIAWIGLECLGLLPEDLKLLAGVGEALGIGAYAVILLSAAGSVLGHARALGILPVDIPGVQPTNKSKQ
jgi:hypothetical protein